MNTVTFGQISRINATAKRCLSRRVSKPTEADWAIAKRCLRYLKGSHDLGILYSSSSNNSITAYSDSDYAGDGATYKSTSGIVILSGKSPIVWRSRLQKHATTSTSEAELSVLSPLPNSHLY